MKNRLEFCDILHAFPTFSRSLLDQDFALPKIDNEKLQSTGFFKLHTNDIIPDFSEVHSRSAFADRHATELWQTICMDDQATVEGARSWRASDPAGVAASLKSRFNEAAVDVACWCAVQADGNEPYFRAWLNVFKLLKAEQQQAALPDDSDTY